MFVCVQSHCEPPEVLQCACIIAGFSFSVCGFVTTFHRLFTCAHCVMSACGNVFLHELFIMCQSSLQSTLCQSRIWCLSTQAFMFSLVQCSQSGTTAGTGLSFDHSRSRSYIRHRHRKPIVFTHSVPLCLYSCIFSYSHCVFRSFWRT